MSQPKSQLETFKASGGGESHIAYYLNSHNLDILSWPRGICLVHREPRRESAPLVKYLSTILCTDNLLLNYVVHS